MTLVLAGRLHVEATNRRPMNLVQAGSLHVG